MSRVLTHRPSVTSSLFLGVLSLDIILLHLDLLLSLQGQTRISAACAQQEKKGTMSRRLEAEATSEN